MCNTSKIADEIVDKVEWECGTDPHDISSGMDSILDEYLDEHNMKLNEIQRDEVFSYLLDIILEL